MKEKISSSTCNIPRGHSHSTNERKQGKQRTVKSLDEDAKTRRGEGGEIEEGKGRGEMFQFVKVRGVVHISSICLKTKKETQHSLELESAKHREFLNVSQNPFFFNPTKENIRRMYSKEIDKSQFLNSANEHFVANQFFKFNLFILYIYSCNNFNFKLAKML